MIVSVLSAFLKPKTPQSRADGAAEKAETRRRHCLMPIARWAAAIVLLGSVPALAQTDPVIRAGDLAVTGFSGTVEAPGGSSVPAGEDRIDETFIDPDGAVLTVFDVSSPGGPPEAQVVGAPTRHEVPARDIGQVFGVALDDADPANIYVTATAAHGLQIVTRDADGDGRPERVRQGQSGARWMEGQFGPGGPGAVYRIDGRNGSVTQFSEIAPGGRANRGAALGNIAFDPVHRQFFVSDFQSGLIHRLDMNGQIQETFDHGQNGRPRLGLQAVSAQGSAADIQSGNFDPADPGTWGLADERRRVWGLAHYGGRLYYAPVSGPQIWSIGLAQDGSFERDPEWELDVATRPSDHPVGDITFDESGRMYLTQRGGLTSSYDYDAQQADGPNRVLRYRLETPDNPNTLSRWVKDPEEYAVGFPGNFRNAAGGIAIGYGYKRQPDGDYGFGPCEGTLWSTGDALRDNDRYSQSLSPGGPLVVHGLQGNAMSLVRPQNEPPWQSYYVDYDGAADVVEQQGHVGDVAIFRDCRDPDLRVYKDYDIAQCEGERCTFTIRIVNEGEGGFEGRLRITETGQGGARLVDSRTDDGQQWECVEDGVGRYGCDGGERRLDPEGEITLELEFEIPVDWPGITLRNCVELDLPEGYQDAEGYDNRICTYVPRCEVDEEYCEPDLELEKFPLSGSCDWRGNCAYVVRATNTGAAEYSGRIAFADALPNGATLAHYRPSPAWTCRPIGSETFTCEQTGARLAPGQHTEVVIVVSAPPYDQGYRYVVNCAQIDWAGGEGDFNAGNDYACAEIPRYPPGHKHSLPALDIEKTAANCEQGAGQGSDWRCRFAVTVKNVGSAPYYGPIDLVDESGARSRTGGNVNATFASLKPSGSAWSCNPGPRSSARQVCTHPPIAGGLQPGDKRSFVLAFDVPPETAVMKNCTATEQDRDGDGVPEQIKGCDTAIVCVPGSQECPQDLRLEKVVRGGSCEPGKSCRFHVGVQNLGSGAVFQRSGASGALFSDTPNFPHGSVRSAAPAIATCSSGGGGSYECRLNTIIRGGDTVSVPIDIEIPADINRSNAENCAEITVGGPANSQPFNDSDCAVAHIAGPDLTPVSHSTCRRGENCDLLVELENVGQRPFTGTVTLEGTLDPGVPVESVSGDGLSCQLGDAGYSCSGELVSVPANGALPINLVISVPADFAPDQITHSQSLQWPDDGDRNSENDEHSSIIEIVGEQEKEDQREEDGEDRDEGREENGEEDREQDGRSDRPGQPDLAIFKNPNANVCQEGEACGFGVRIENRGDAAHSGPIEFADQLSASARLRYVGPGGVECSGGGNSYSCSHPAVTLEPGGTTNFNLSFVPGGDARQLENCIEIDWGVQPGGDRVLAVQRALNDGGYGAGPEDGLYGQKTASGIRAYQRDAGLEVTGEITPSLLSSLFGGGDANAANDRACASVEVEVTREPDRDRDTGDGAQDRRDCPPGAVLNDAGNCICPQERPDWTGERCIDRQEDRDDGSDQGSRQCFGGQVPVDGECVCPDERPRWNGEECRPPREDGIDPGDVVEEIPDLIGEGDGSDEAGEDPQECPRGQRWSAELSDCVAADGGGGQDRQDCPPGQTWAVELGCVSEDGGGDGGGMNLDLNVPESNIPGGVEEGVGNILE